MRRLLLGLLGVIALGGAIPAGAGAVIVPHKSIAGVRIGMTEAQVRAVLGGPSSARTEATEILGRHRRLEYGGLTVLLYEGRGGRVYTVSTRRVSERTARGVGVGSRRSFVRTRVSGVACRTDFGFQRCTVGTPLAGRIVTVFHLSPGYLGRVTRVVVGRVID